MSRYRTYSLYILAACLAGCGPSREAAAPKGDGSMYTLITLDPAHFHAGLVQKEMYPGVSKKVFVYAPLGTDLTAHLNRIALFNQRKDRPTSWELDIRTSPDFMERMLREKPGNIVVLSGRNRLKMERIQASVEGGLNVLADKPWILKSDDLPKVAAALEAADAKGLIAYDIMTERFEVTSLLQRALVGDKSVFGDIVPGTAAEPGVYMESVHHLMKTVAGVASLRPAWFFDIKEQGEGLSDVGTHLVDLVQWTLFPEQMLDYQKDINILDGKRWPTVLTKADFQRVTGAPDFPPYLAEHVKDDKLDYFCNNMVCYTLRGVAVKLDVLWRYEAPAGTGDTHFAVYRGTKSRIEVRQGKAENYRPELFVVPVSPAAKTELAAALKAKVEALQAQWPGVSVADTGKEFKLSIPDSYRVGHEAHFSQVAQQYFAYLKDPKTLPAWEKPFMMAKYYVSTKGTEVGHKK
jgi:predicted dehydrogenase